MATIYSLLFGILFISLCFSPVARNAVLSDADKAIEANFGSCDLLRQRIERIAAAELGVQEVGGENRGARVGTYLAYVGLSEGYEWCAAFVSWCYGQAGLPAPCNAWSPALFPKVRRYPPNDVRSGRIGEADLFALYNSQLGRIYHVGIVKAVKGPLLVSVEGNSHNAVESRRRPLSTIYTVANWVDRL